MILLKTSIKLLHNNILFYFFIRDITQTIFEIIQRHVDTVLFFFSHKSTRTDIKPILKLGHNSIIHWNVLGLFLIFNYYFIIYLLNYKIKLPDVSLAYFY